MTDENVCEHGDHPAPAGKRFCSVACCRCEHESTNEETGCDGICHHEDADNDHDQMRNDGEAEA